MIGSRNVYRCLILILCLAISTGCWDRKEIDDLALVMASGLDLTEDGKFEATLQIALPTGIPSAVQSGGGKQKPVLVVSAKGKEETEIMGKLQQQLSRKISFAHRGVIVFGENYAKDGLNQGPDIFTRSPESRFSGLVVTAYDATAKEILNAPYQMELIPSIGIKKILTDNFTLSYRIDDFLNALSVPGQSPITGAIRIINKGTDKEIFLFDKAAIYQGNRLAGFLSPQQMKILQWWNGDAKRINLSMQMEKPDKHFKGTMRVEILQGRTKIFTSVKNEIQEVTLAFEALLRVVENNTRLDMSKVQNMQRAEAEFTNDVKKEITDLLSLAQHELKSDIFGIGREIHVKHPYVWKKIKDRWIDIYPEIPVRVKVDLKIERMGKTQAPAHLQKGS